MFNYSYRNKIVKHTQHVFISTRVVDILGTVVL